MNKAFLTIVLFVVFCCIEWNPHAQNTILNDAIRMTDSMIVNGAFVNSSNGVRIIPDTSKIVGVMLHDMFEGLLIDNNNLVLKYSTDSTEYDNHHLSMSVFFDDDEFGVYGYPFVDVSLLYYKAEDWECVTVYKRYIWSVLYFIKDNSVIHYRILEMAE